MVQDNKFYPEKLIHNSKIRSFDELTYVAETQVCIKCYIPLVHAACNTGIVIRFDLYGSENEVFIPGSYTTPKSHVDVSIFDRTS